MNEIRPQITQLILILSPAFRVVFIFLRNVIQSSNECQLSVVMLISVLMKDNVMGRTTLNMFTVVRRSADIVRTCLNVVRLLALRVS